MELVKKTVPSGKIVRTLTGSRDFFPKKENIYPILLVILTAAYNFIWLNRSFIMTEAWSKFYLGLMANGKVPYRDFFYNLPPLNLLIDFLIWSLSFNNFFIFRLWRLVERILIAEIMYKIMRRKAEPFLAFLGAFFSVIVETAHVHDAIGDYNQTAQLLMSLLCVALLKYTDHIDNLYLKQRWMTLCGFIGGLMFLNKQNFTLAAAIVFCLFILFLALAGIEKNLLRMIACVILGAAIPIGSCCVWLLKNDILSSFIYQAFIDTGSKGGLFHILIGAQIDTFWGNLGTLVILYSIGIWCANQAKKKFSYRKGSLTVLQITLLIFIGLWINFSYLWDIISVFRVFILSGLLVVMTVAAVPLLYLEFQKDKKHLFITVEFLLCSTLLFFNLNYCAESLCRQSNGFELITVAVTLLHFFLVVWLLLHVLCHALMKSNLELDTMIVVCTAISFGYAISMSVGIQTIHASTAFFSVPALVWLLFRTKKSVSFTVKTLFECAFLIVFCISFSQKLVNNFNWWGDSEASFWDKTESSAIPMLKGFLFSPQEKEKYDELTRVIAENTDKNSVIFGFPYVKVYNVFLENYNMNNFVPVLFYDVCPDDYAIQDAETLSVSPPDIIVWLDILNCLEVYEDVFRDGGRLGQRDIQKWFSSVKDTNYELIGQAENVFVYRLKTEDENANNASYTYIQDPERTNVTAEYSEEERGDNFWQFFIYEP